QLANRQQFLKRAGVQDLPNGSESLQYEFKHALYREVLYREIPPTRLRQMHLRLAERMEALSAPTGLSLLSELAVHFEEGRNYEQAVKYLILASSEAARRYSHADSLRLLHHALELLPHVGAGRSAEFEIQILEKLSDALYAQGEMEQSAEIDERVVQLAARLGLKVVQVSALTRLARALAFLEPDRCIAVCEKAVEVGRTMEDPLLLARAEMLAACWRIISHGWRQEKDPAIERRGAGVLRDPLRTRPGHFGRLPGGLRHGPGWNPQSRGRRQLGGLFVGTLFAGPGAAAAGTNRRTPAGAREGVGRRGEEPEFAVARHFLGGPRLAALPNEGH